MSHESVHFNISVGRNGGGTRDESCQAVKPDNSNQGHRTTTPPHPDDMIVRHGNRRSSTYNTENWQKEDLRESLPQACPPNGVSEAQLSLNVHLDNLCKSPK